MNLAKQLDEAPLSEAIRWSPPPALLAGEVEAWDTPDHEGNTLLMRAVRERRLETVIRLMQLGFSPHRPNPRTGRSAYELALDEGFQAAAQAMMGR